MSYTADRTLNETADSIGIELVPEIFPAATGNYNTNIVSIIDHFRFVSTHLLLCDALLTMVFILYAYSNNM